MNLFITPAEVMNLGLRLVGLAIAAGLAVLLIASVYRWYLGEELPQGVGLLIGATIIAVWLNTTATLGYALGGTTDLVTPQAGAYTITAFLIGGIAAESGRITGDRIGAAVMPGWGIGGLDREVRALVRGGGRTLRVELPETIRDIDGADPVRPAVKDELSGKVLSFPGRLTHEELRELFVTQLTQDYDIEQVDVEFDEGGQITYLGLARAKAGIGHRLPPGQVAIALVADPAFATGSGDRVHIHPPAEPEVSINGEIQTVVDDVVTVAIDEEDAPALQAEGPYQLTTLPQGPRGDREFAAILRRAPETIIRQTIAEDSEHLEVPVGSLEVGIISLERADGEILAPPADDIHLKPGDTVLAIARRDALRRFEAGAQTTS